MLNQLIESRKHGAENARKNGFLITTLGVLVAVLLSGWTYSLFAKNFGMNAGELDLSSIVTPVAPSEEEPPAPEPEQKQPEREQTANNNQRQTLIEKNVRMEDSLDNPPKIGDARPLRSSPLRPSDLKNYDISTENNIRSRNSEGTENGDGLNKTNSSKTDQEETKMPEVVVKPKPVPTPEVNKPKTLQSGGVLNGKATNLVTPAYPAAAKAMGIKDTVQVQVTIDEKGNVISAAAASGHMLLRAVAVQAARQSKFSPTYLSNQPVKVTGVIVYRFQ